MIQETIDRLTGGSFALVGGSADIDEDIPLPNIPAAFVVLGAERASDSTSINAIQQEITSQIVILYAVRNVRDQTGVEAIKDLKPLRQEVKNKLVAWRPLPECDPVIFRGGQLLKLDTAGVIWWVDTFETSFIERHL
jgi:hypothetical protein